MRNKLINLANNLIKLGDLESMMPKLTDYAEKNLKTFFTDVEVFVKEINSYDPSGTDANYTMWILKNHNDIDDAVKEYLNYYDLNRKKEFWTQSRDIYSWNYYDLKKYIDELKAQGLGSDISGKQKKKQIKIEGATEVFNNGTYRIVECTTPEAACEYGRGSKWCTANPNDLSYAKSYLSQSPLYRIWKNNELYASFHPGKMSLMDIFDDDMWGDDSELTKILFISILKKDIYNSPKDAYEFAELGGGEYIPANHLRFPEGEPAIATSAVYSYRYALKVLRGSRFPEGEPAIATSAEYSYYYAKYIIGGGRRFPEGEPAILTNPSYTLLYVKDIMEERFPEGEPIIATNASDAYEYAKDVLKLHTSEAETWGERYLQGKTKENN